MSPTASEIRARLKEIPKQIRQAKSEEAEPARREADIFKQRGKLLIEAQQLHAKLGAKAGFKAWVDDNCPFGWRLAYNLINTYQHFHKLSLATLARFDQTALYLLAERSTPEKARAAALLEAMKGKTIPKKRASELIAKYKGTPKPAGRLKKRIELEDSKVVLFYPRGADPAEVLRQALKKIEAK